MLRYVLGALVLLSNASSDFAAEPAVSIDVTKDTLTFRAGNAVVTRYHVGPDVAKPYSWPLYAPGDIPLTRFWPMEKGAPKETKDHVHQKSAWFCHGDVIPEGMELKAKTKGVEGVDFWSEADGHGKIVCEPQVTGDLRINWAMPNIATHNVWLTAEGVKILDEDRDITLKLVGENRLLIFDIDLHASVCPITFADTKEGAFGVRVNDEIRLDSKGPKSKMVNADSKSGEKEIWGFKSDWCDYSGEIGGNLAGIAVFDDPKNAYRACWHARAYGLMAANPFGRDRSGFPAVKGQTDLVKLRKGEHLKLRYAIYVHTGDAESGKVAEAFKVFCTK
ncbi:MAG TPA: PmoA family protein [Gemmataceae bacterium]|nr:PmoA family protein [Gemmataceae bacterium]